MQECLNWGKFWHYGYMELLKFNIMWRERHIWKNITLMLYCVSTWGFIFINIFVSVVCFQWRQWTWNCDYFYWLCQFWEGNIVLRSWLYFVKYCSCMLPEKNYYCLSFLQFIIAWCCLLCYGNSVNIVQQCSPGTLWNFMKIFHLLSHSPSLFMIYRLHQ